MNARRHPVAALGLAVLLSLAGCTALPSGPGDGPAGTVHVEVQNGGPDPLSVELTVENASGAAVATERDRLPANVGRTFDVAVDEPGRYEVTVAVGDSVASGAWLTDNCAELTVRVEVDEDRGVHSAWRCVPEETE